MPPTEANNRLAPRKRIRSKPFKTPMTWDEKRCKNFNMAASPRGIIATTTIYSGKQPPSSPPFGCGYAALGKLLCKSRTPPFRMGRYRDDQKKRPGRVEQPGESEVGRLMSLRKALLNNARVRH